MNEILFVLGNGPSLGEIMNNPDYLNLLKKRDTFALNSSYRAFKEYNFYPTYFGCFDYIVNESHKQEFEKLVLENNSIKKFYFIGNIIKKQKMYHPKVYNSPRFQKFNFINTHNPKFTKNINKFENFGSSGANASQVGLILGYKNIILLGCDCNYVEKVEGVESYDKKKKHKLVLTKNIDNNPNYWFNDYQIKGDKFNLPQTKNIQLKSWENLKKLAPKNIIIMNGSMISKIPYFPKTSFKTIYEKINNNII